MNEHLRKAKAALEAAAGLEVDLDAETLPKRYLRLLDLANIQAQVAQAEILDRVATRLGAR